MAGNPFARRLHQEPQQRRGITRRAEADAKIYLDGLALTGTNRHPALMVVLERRQPEERRKTFTVADEMEKQPIGEILSRDVQKARGGFIGADDDAAPVRGNAGNWDFVEQMLPVGPFVSQAPEQVVTLQLRAGQGL